MVIDRTFSLGWIGDRVSQMFKRLVRVEGLETDEAHTTLFSPASLALYSDP